MKKRFVLAGDIGGTNARFAVFEIGKTPRAVRQDVLESRSFKSFQAALERFLGGSAGRGRETIAAATFGIAGPVVEQRVKTTNLPWSIDARAIAKTFGIPKVTLLNDLVALGLGAVASPPSKLAVVHLGRPQKTGANLGVIAAGTGLGEAAFVWDGHGHVACATEGSHVDFAPRSELEDELLGLLRGEYGHVSYERIASGSTIERVYRFFVETRKVKETKQAAALIAGADDKNRAIVDLAESGRSEAAMKALDLWAGVYGAEAGNLALKCLATGGIYVCGGVSARLADILANGLPAARKGKKAAAKGVASPFIEGFLDKGRMRPLLENIPVAVCLESRAGLMGAVAHAAGALG